MKPATIFLAWLGLLLIFQPSGHADVTGPGALSRSDQLRALYAGSISFTEKNMPLIRLRVTEDAKKIKIGFKKGIYLLPDGPSGPRIELAGSGSLKLEIIDTRPAVRAYRVRLEKVRAGDLAQVIKRKKWWTSLGIKVDTVEIGSIFGFHGTILDNREVRLVAYPEKNTRKHAKTLSRRLQKISGKSTLVESWITELPTGTLKVTVADRKLLLTATSVFWLEAPAGSHLTVKDVSYLDQTRGERTRKDRKLSGTFYAVPGLRGELVLVQVMDAEKLLKGIVPAEIYPNAPPAALQAQAITARGDLLEKLGKRHLNDPYLLCNDVHCQAHRGESLEVYSTNLAVDNTRGQVLFYNKDIVPAVYHASCGGHTERNDDVWPGAIPHAALRGSKDVPNSAMRDAYPQHQGQPWTDEMVSKTLEKPSQAFCALPTKGKASFRWLRPLYARELKLLDPKGNLGEIKSLQVIRRGVGGHATKVRLVGTKGSYDIHPELVIRRKLGGKRPLRSTLFVLKSHQNPNGTLARIDVLGGGFGHGVGMCQNGAVGMAEKGYPTEQILRHYYAGTEVHRIY